MLQLNHVHHIAIICKDYAVSKKFYTKVLGFAIEQEIYRKEREPRHRWCHECVK